MKLRVGVIGTGFGSQVQIPAFQAHPRAEVVAVSSHSPGKAARIAEQFSVASGAAPSDVAGRARGQPPCAL